MNDDLEDVLDPGLLLCLPDWDGGGRQVCGLCLGAEEEQGDKEGHYGEYVNDVHPILKKLNLLWRSCQSVR